jgi:predicted MPP superfamily phosphohydrolase
MNTTIIQLSDLHYRKGWHESHGIVLEAFIEDLKKQIEALNQNDIYLSFSGDIVQSGSEKSEYDDFFGYMDERLNSLGITKNRRICVPGNHDISQLELKKNAQEHEGLINLELDETKFNEYIRKESNVFDAKFINYIEFENEFAEYRTLNDSVGGAGWELNEDIGIFCLNTALCSSAGLAGQNGLTIKEKHRLAVDTRSLYLWAANCKSTYKVLIMHHPIEWLSEWAQTEVRNILRNKFSICLSGHSHEQVSLFSISEDNTLLECSSPPLFTNKKGDLGYSYVTIDNLNGIDSVNYRQWTKQHKFVSGTGFSNTDSGSIQIKRKVNNDELIDKTLDSKEHGFIDRYLSRRLDDALQAFSSQPKWVDPVLGRISETTSEIDPSEKVDIVDFFTNIKSTIIKSPPQFGLTCLAHYLRKEVWCSNEKFWLYFDAKAIKPNNAAINAAADVELQLLGKNYEDVSCIILDSWDSQDKSAQKLLRKLVEKFSNLPIVVMQTLDNTHLIDAVSVDNYNVQFEVLFLWSLPRNHVRKVVAGYIESKQIGDEDAVTTRVVADLEVLNLHRTPLNCLTLLKASEVDFDESPVNRTEVIKRILFLLFNVDEMPTYKVRPDLKDCEYVLGYFCEKMLREESYSFTRNIFLSVLKRFCKEQYIDLELEVVFDVLHSNNILIRRGNFFFFRFRYWIYYFAAHRMHQNTEFAEFIYNDMKYASHPEIIEFYTGIDRRREDALNVLLEDLNKICNKVEEKCGLPDGLNPFQMAQWTPSEDSIKKMHDEIADGVVGSGLPDSVKDHYADRTYDRKRPYDQNLSTILDEYSLVLMIRTMSAAGRALRNSDYVDPNIKSQLLNEITRSWEQIAKVLFVVLPLLAEKQHAVFDGMGFVLAGKFGDTPEERFMQILFNIPSNVVFMSRDDLFSKKMGPLLIEQIRNESNILRKHKLILLLITSRPRGWKSVVSKYISDSQKNSFYLCDIYNCLRNEYRYSYASSNSIADLQYLIKMSLAKHVTGARSPGAKLISKVSDDAIPDRVIKDVQQIG